MAKISTYENPCETCPQKELAKWGSCNHGIGICEECMKYYKRKGEGKKELIKEMKK